MSNWKHIVQVISLYSLIAIAQIGTFFQYTNSPKAKWDGDFGTAMTLIMIVSQLSVFFIIPQLICDLIGLTLFNTFPREVELRTSNADCNAAEQGVAQNIKPIDWPHVCFRIVTRGSYPELVRTTVHTALITSIECGLVNFSIEILTEKEVVTDVNDARIRQLVVPSSYQPAMGSLFKARNLQYALEPGVSPIKSGDYIMHLDEETCVTRDSIFGIVNFMLDGKHAFGQGLKSYAHMKIVNLLTTASDSGLVGEDLGKLRFSMAVLHQPIYGWKGSFILCTYDAEKDVSFDHGPDASVAEDLYFALMAWQKGYTFGWIEGDMYERSAFTVMDLIRQRKRWFQGTWLTLHSSKIGLKYKSILLLSFYVWCLSPLVVISSAITTVYPTLVPFWCKPIGSTCLAVIVHIYYLGMFKSLERKAKSFKFLLAFMIIQIFAIITDVLVNCCAVIWGVFSPKHRFYVVDKKLEGPDD